MLLHKWDSAPFSFYSSLMESICMRSPIHCLLLTPASKFFNKYFHVSVYFSRQPPVNQCVCQKNTTKKTSPISFSSSDSCDARAETVRPIETYKIAFFPAFNFPQIKTDTQEAYERVLHSFSYTRQSLRNWQKLKFRPGTVMVWKNAKPMTKAAMRRNGEQVVIAVSHSLSLQTWNHPRGLDFSDKDPKVCLLFMSAKMCEKMPDL